MSKGEKILVPIYTTRAKWRNRRRKEQAAWGLAWNGMEYSKEGRDTWKSYLCLRLLIWALSSCCQPMCHIYWTASSWIVWAFHQVQEPERDGNKIKDNPWFLCPRLSFLCLSISCQAVLSCSSPSNTCLKAKQLVPQLGSSLPQLHQVRF